MFRRDRAVLDRDAEVVIPVLVGRPDLHQDDVDGQPAVDDVVLHPAQVHGEEIELTGRELAECAVRCVRLDVRPPRIGPQMSRCSPPPRIPASSRSR